MQIAWYSPTHDKIVVQDCSSYSEEIIDWSMSDDPGGKFIGDAINEALSSMNSKMSFEMFYGENFHWLEQGLWVRLGEVQMNENITFEELRALGCPDGLLMQYRIGWTKLQIYEMCERAGYLCLLRK